MLDKVLGRLAADPEQRFTNDGTAVCTIRLALPPQDQRIRAQASQRPLGAQGEAVAKYMSKGRRWL